MSLTSLKEELGTGVRVSGPFCTRLAPWGGGGAPRKQPSVTSAGVGSLFRFSASHLSSKSPSFKGSVTLFTRDLCAKTQNR